VTRVVEIDIAPGRRLPTRSVPSVEAEAGVGLVGDRYHGAKHRHVTVQARDELDLAARDLGTPIESAATRRNITVDRGPLPTRPGERLRVGPVLLEVVRVAAPCRLLDDGIGPGAAAALRRRAGTVFRILESGTIAVGDPVEPVAPLPSGGPLEHVDPLQQDAAGAQPQPTGSAGSPGPTAQT
jgi:MOSC domain-containing protein YiiM